MHGTGWGGSFLGRGNSKCKGPGVGKSLVYSWGNRKTGGDRAAEREESRR